MDEEQHRRFPFESENCVLIAQLQAISAHVESGELEHEFVVHPDL